MQTPSVFMDYLMVKELTEYSGLAVFPLVLVSSSFEAKDSYEVIGANVKEESDESEDNEESEINKEGEDSEECEDKASRICVIETGEMDSVRIANHGELPALVLDGSILIGGAANRMLTTSAVIRKGEIVNLPVVSVEASRWDCLKFPTGKTQIVAPDLTFTGSDFAPSSLRRVRLEKSILTMKKEGISRVKQDMIWKHIESLFGKSFLETQNLDVCELYEHWDYLIREYSSRFVPEELQVGCIVFIDRKTWYLDVFYNSEVFRSVFPNLLKSYVLEAIMARVGLDKTHDNYHWVPELMDAQDAFAKIKLIKFHTLHATGREGEELAFFASRKACGTALTDGPALMHMTACSRWFGED